MTTQTLPNLKFADFTAFLKEVGKLGDKEATGQLQRAEFAVNCAIAAAEGHINAKPEEALKIWRAYRKSHHAKLNGNVVDTESSEKSEKIRASELLQIIKSGMLPSADFAQTLERARPVIANADFIKGNTWDNMVKLARFQLKTEQEGRRLTDEEIETALTPEKKEKEYDEVSALKALVKSMEKLRDGTEGNENSAPKPAFPSPELEAAIDQLGNRILILEIRLKSSLIKKVA
jgi:hypothetical protein